MPAGDHESGRCGRRVRADDDGLVYRNDLDDGRFGARGAATDRIRAEGLADIAPPAAEAHRVLAPGGRWALADTVVGPAGDPSFPVPGLTAA